MQDYNKLKTEAKRYAMDGKNSFIEMAKRLTIIKNEKLYTNDKYRSFYQFIKHELPVSRRTVYNYISIVEHIGSEPFDSNPNFDQSKIIPLFPLLKSKNDDIPKEEIKTEIIEDINKGKSAADVKTKIDSYKKQYNLQKETNDIGLVLLLSDNEISLNGETVIEFSDRINDETRELIYDAIERNNKIINAVHNSIEESIEEQTITYNSNNFIALDGITAAPNDNQSFLIEYKINELQEAK